MLTPWIPSLWQLGPPGPSKEAGCLQSPQEGGFTLEWLGWTDAGETLMGNVLLSQCVSQSSSHLAWNVAEIHNAVILLLFPMLTLPTRLHLIPLSSDRVGQNLQYKYPWQELCPRPQLCAPGLFRDHLPNTLLLPALTALTGSVICTRSTGQALQDMVMGWKPPPPSLGSPLGQQHVPEMSPPCSRA